MNRRIVLQGALFLSLLAIDQLSKWWIMQPGFHPIAVIDGCFNIVRAFNTGVAFSMFADLPEQWRVYLLLAVTGAIAVAIAAWWFRERSSPGPLSWLLVVILAGAVGNFWDRLQLGYVVDFLQCYVVMGGTAHYFPSFNFADSCISVGVVLLLVASTRRP